MKNLLTQRMESVIITMHALEMKEQPIKLENIADLMKKDMNLKTTSNVLRELQSRELVVKVGKARYTIYCLTKKAKDALENKSLASLLEVKSIHRDNNSTSVSQNKINPSHVSFMKQMNEFLKEHENLLQENKSLKEENSRLKGILNLIKQKIN